MPFELRPLGTSPRLDLTSGTAVAHLALPFGQPRWGTVNDRSWSAIHSAPPWTTTAHPVLVEHRFGAGRAVYSAFDLERSPVAANRSLFAHLVRDLLGERATSSAEARSSVWMTVLDQPERARVLVTLLRYTEDQPVPSTSR